MRVHGVRYQRDARGPEAGIILGAVFLIFLDGTGTGVRDTAAADTRILRIDGVVDDETTGSEIWMDDVTGDGLADLLICRQNFTPEKATMGNARAGAGALTILVGGAEVGTHAATLQVVDQGTGGLHIFDISDPDNIVARDSDDTNLQRPTAVAVQNNHAYVVDGDNALLQIFDVSNPDTIVSRGSTAVCE